MLSNMTEALLDEAVEDSFPASDPPSYMAGASVPGSPRRFGVGDEARKAADHSKTSEDERSNAMAGVAARRPGKRNEARPVTGTANTQAGDA